MYKWRRYALSPVEASDITALGLSADYCQHEHINKVMQSYLIIIIAEGYIQVYTWFKLQMNMIIYHLTTALIVPHSRQSANSL